MVKVFGVVETENDSEEFVKEELKAGTSYIFEENGCTVKYSIEDVWAGNYNAKVEITNTSSETIHNWMIAFACDDEISNIYNGKIEERKDCVYYIKNVEYNQDINVGETITFGFQVSYTDSADLPEGFVVHEVESFVPVSSYQVETVTVNEWEGGYTGEIRITNLGEQKLEDWCLSFTCADEIVDLWNADIVSVEDGVYTIRNTDSRQNIEVGGSFTVGFRANGDAHELDVVHMCVVNSGADIEDTTEEPTEDVSEDPSEDISEEPSEDISEDPSEEPSEEPSEDVSEDPSEDSSEDVSEEPSEDNSEETSEEPSEDTSEDIDPEESNIIVNTENLRAGDLEDTYYVDGEIHELTGTLTGAEQVEKVSYILKDVNETILLEGTIFHRANGVTPKDSWTIPEFGLAIGVNILTFTLELDNDVVKEQSIRLIDVTGANMGRVNIDLNDSDEDGLNNYFESVLKTDLELSDTDEDGISDFDEFLYVGTDPLLYDTDGNGVSDGEEDFDTDGLNSIEECTYQTNVIMADTDDDGIEDKDEIRVTFTDPLVADTDEDGLKDGTENKLSLNPLIKDTDSDGILDGEEVYTQTTETVIGDEESVIESVTVTVPCAGEIDDQFFIADASGWDEIVANVVGIVGVPVEIATDIEFEEATLTFQYDPALLDGASEDNLGILWYDKENLEFVEMENVTVDKTQHTVSCVTTHFSEYLVVDMETWQNAWLSQTDYSQYREPLDIAIMSDSTAAVFSNWTKGYGMIDVSDGYIDGENIIYGFFNVQGGHTRTGWATNMDQYSDNFSNILYYHFYSTGSTERGGRNGKYGDGFEELVEIYTRDTYSNLNSDNPKVALFTYDGYLLQTAEQDQKVLDSCEKLKELGVTIYAVSETDATVSVIEQAAVSSGGFHFNVSNQAEGRAVWNEIHELERDTAHLDVDSDCDGLSDGYEIYGMRIQNGKVITTDPENPDTDGDDEKKDGTRNDGSEMGKMSNVTVKVEAAGTKREFTIFKMISNPNESDNLSEDFIYVDSLDYMPTYDVLYNRMYIDEVTAQDVGTLENPLDRNNHPIYGLVNLHNSVDFSIAGQTPRNEYDDIEYLYSKYNQWLCIVFLVKSVESTYFIENVAAVFLDHFLLNSGITYEYEGNWLHSHMVNYALLANLYYVKPMCLEMLEPGETIYIATAPTVAWGCASNPKGDGINTLPEKLLNYNAYLGVNDGDAVITAKCSYDGNAYSIEYNYYILDFYDWKFENHPNLYSLNLYGISNAFLSIGKISGYATFTDANSEILNFQLNY